MRLLLSSLLLCLCFSSLYAEYRNIELRSGTLNTLSTPDFSTQHKFLRFDNSKELKWLVHFRGPITNKMKEDFTQAVGVELGRYIPHHTFIVKATSEVALKAKEHSTVLWVGALLPEHRISEQIASWSEVKEQFENALYIQHDELNANTRKELFAQWKRALEDLGYNDVTFRSETKTISYVSTKFVPEVASLLAKQTEISWIEPIPHYYSQGLWATRSTLSENPDFNAPQNPFAGRETPIVGTGQTITLIDSDVEVDHCYFKSNRPNVTCFRSSGCTGSKAHGTSMAGIIIGNPENSKHQGVAPGAGLRVHSFPTGGSDKVESNKISIRASEFLDVFHSVTIQGSRILVGGFSGTSTSYDLLAQEIDGSIYSSEYVLVILPAGNTQSGVASPALSKNVLTVGSTQNDIAGLRSNMDFIPAAGQKNIGNRKLTPLFGRNTLSTFSSRGPTNDFRFKPDVVAPGEIVYSAASGTCGHTAYSGTSYAAAVVAGAAAIVRNYIAKGLYAQTPTINPTSAQIKAVLIASGAPVLGVSANGELGTMERMEYFAAQPNPGSGFGRVVLSTLLNFDNNNPSFFLDLENKRKVTTGSSQRFCFSADPGTRVKVVVVWNDFAATQASRFALINNIDVVVVDRTTGREYRANGLSTYDNVNNVEQVSFTVPSTSSGLYAAIVHGTNIPEGKDGQSFATVVALVGDIINDFGMTCGSLPVDVCPNNCSKNGKCEGGICTCYANFFGPDCSLDLCQGKCSKNNKGVCDGETGYCICAGGQRAESCDDDVPTSPPIVTVEVFRGRRVRELAVGIPIGVVCGIIVGALIGYFVSKLVMERQRKKRREQLLISGGRF